jgi:Rieske Fe-S protein
VIVAAAAVTAACGSSGTSSPSTSPAGAGSATLATSDVPVGGGKILADQKLVVTQPVAGTYKAFSAVCTHQGCTVASVANGTITCPCHGSTYSAADGSVTGGPAPAPLASVPVTVSGTTITLA